MRLTLTRFRAEDGVAILGRNAEAVLDWLIKAECEGPAFTGRLPDGRILGAAGLIFFTPEIADAWLLPTPLVKEFPLTFHKAVVREFRALLAQFPNLKYVTGHTDDAFPERDGWVQRLGFTRTGHNTILWPVKQDVTLYAYTRNGHGH